MGGLRDERGEEKVGKNSFTEAALRKSWKFWDQAQNFKLASEIPTKSLHTGHWEQSISLDPEGSDSGRTLCTAKSDSNSPRSSLSNF